MIPIYLIVQGVSSVILLSLILACFISCNDDDKATCWFKLMIFAISFTTLALVSLHFVGAYWVFGVYGELQTYGTCASNCYMLAFIILTVSLVCYGCSLLLSPCVLAGKICVGVDVVDGRRNIGVEGGKGTTTRIVVKGSITTWLRSNVFSLLD